MGRPDFPKSLKEFQARFRDDEACRTYLAAHARRLYAAVTDAARVAAALLATPALRRPAGEPVHRARWCTARSGPV